MVTLLVTQATHMALSKQFTALPGYTPAKHWQARRQDTVARVRRGRRLLQNQTIPESVVLLDVVDEVDAGLALQGLETRGLRRLRRLEPMLIIIPY